jgi:broad specificity phosphatase PhoE
VPPREPAATRLVLIRTAAVERQGPVCLIDHDDLGLSEDGRRQTDQLAQRFSATGELDDTTRLCSATSNRAQQTAAAIAPALGGPPIQTSCAFCEPHIGQANGLAVDDWLATDGQARLDNWSPYRPKSVGGESYAVGIERSARAIAETVVENEGGTVVIVTHTVPIRATFWLFLGLPFHASYLDLDISETGITEWIVTGWLPGSGHPKARLVRHNDHRHLLNQA